MSSEMNKWFFMPPSHGTSQTPIEFIRSCMHVRVFVCSRICFLCVCLLTICVYWTCNLIYMINWYNK